MAVNNDTPAQSEPEPTREELLRMIHELREKILCSKQTVSDLLSEFHPLPDDFDAKGALVDCDPTSIPEITEELEREYGSAQ